MTFSTHTLLISISIGGFTREKEYCTQMQISIFRDEVGGYGMITARKKIRLCLINSNYQTFSAKSVPKEILMNRHGHTYLKRYQGNEGAEVGYGE